MITWDLVIDYEYQQQLPQLCIISSCYIESKSITKAILVIFSILDKYYLLPIQEWFYDSCELIILVKIK